MLDPTFMSILTRHLRYLDGELTPDASLRALGLDSMASVALMVDLEDAFGVTLPDRLVTMETFANAGTLWQAISGARSAN